MGRGWRGAPPLFLYHTQRRKHLNAICKLWGGACRCRGWRRGCTIAPAPYAEAKAAGYGLRAVGRGLQISLDNMWTTVASGILGFSFIFGNSIRGVFESILTLFVIHPFDVGDTLFLAGSFHVIEEASLTKVPPPPPPPPPPILARTQARVRARAHTHPVGRGGVCVLGCHATSKLQVLLQKLRVLRNALLVCAAAARRVACPRVCPSGTPRPRLRYTASSWEIGTSL